MLSATDILDLAGGIETARVDFKQVWTFDTPATKAELVKDVMAFANSHDRGTAYILYGINDNGAVLGLASPVPDQANVQQYLDSNLDPPVPVTFYSVSVNGVDVAVLEIPESASRFHVPSKDVTDGSGRQFLRAGETWIRRGSRKSPVRGHDFTLLTERYSRPEPQLAIAFAGGSTHIDTVRNWPTPQDILAQLVALCVRPPNSGMIPHRFVPLRFYVRNDGKTLADRIVVDISFPPDCEALLAITDERAPKGWSLRRRPANAVRLNGADLVHGDEYSPGEVYVRFFRRDVTYEIKWKASAGNMREATEGILTVRILPSSE